MEKLYKIANYIFSDKGSVVFMLIFLLIVSIMTAIFSIVRLNDAIGYIDALESDFPEYIDTTSGTDAYSNWHR